MKHLAKKLKEQCFKTAIEQGFDGTLEEYIVTVPDYDWIITKIANDAGYQFGDVVDDMVVGNTSTDPFNLEADDDWFYICDESELGL